MKIGLLGNMNNNNFAIMRYFRDLGHDAHLLLFSNDGVGQSQHFRPECDTWDISHWERFIHRLPISDDPTSVFDFPLSFLLSTRSFLRSAANPKLTGYRPVTKKKIQAAFRDYDRLLGSGITPALLHRAGLNLSIFFPYALGVEWYKDPVFEQKLTSGNILTRRLAQAIVQRQTEAIRKVRKVICADMSLTAEALKAMGVDPIFSLCPMVYNKEQIPTTSGIVEVDKTLDRLKESDFSVLSHARHFWKCPANITASAWCSQDKNNDWLIEGFAKLVNEKLTEKPLLILFEYGDDAVHSKALCKELNIEDYVVWLPKLDRKHIMLLLSKVDVGVGEFYELPNILFGGTGYEVLASGKPLIQGFDFDESSFEQTYKIPVPPLLPVKTAGDIYDYLRLIALDSNKRAMLSNQSRAWFDKYCGIGLAKNWASLLIEK